MVSTPGRGQGNPPIAGRSVFYRFVPAGLPAILHRTFPISGSDRSGALTRRPVGDVVLGKGCDAPAMIKDKGRSIAGASGVDGRAGSETVCATAGAPMGSWKTRGDITEEKNWNSQVSDLIHLKEATTAR